MGRDMEPVNDALANASDLETLGISPEARDAAVQLAERLASQMTPNDLSLGYSLLDTVLPELQLDKPGNKLEAMLPAELDIGHDLSLRPVRKRGKEFAKVLVCDSTQDVRASIEAASEVGVHELVVAFLVILAGAASPPVLITVAAALAATVIVRGFREFCREGILLERCQGYDREKKFGVLWRFCLFSQ